MAVFLFSNRIWQVYMSDMILVKVYATPRRGDLFAVVPIAPANRCPAALCDLSDDDLIHVAKSELRSQRRMTNAEIDAFHYRIEGRRSAPAALARPLAAMEPEAERSAAR